MLEEILASFPPHTHPLTLVSDPDDVLADEEILTALHERGFTLIDEPDPVALRHRVENARPWSANHPLIVVTDGALNELPYDLWEQGHRVTLALHTFFPKLAYPVVRTLSPSQRWRLSQVPSPGRRLGRRGSIAFLLRQVFGADPEALEEPGKLVAWLDRAHQRVDPLPEPLAAYLLGQLRDLPIYAEWPLEELLRDDDAYRSFLREQWRGYVQRETGELIREQPVRYVLRFERDEGLQDALGGLMRSGTLEALRVEEPRRLPGWAQPAVLSQEEDRRPRRAAELLELLDERLHGLPQDGRWEDWQRIARAWAELTALRYHPDRPLGPGQRAAYDRLEREIDGAFLAWLRHRYAPLGSRRLPTPHHVYHALPYLDYDRRRHDRERVALLVLDGLSLADWHVVGPTWRARHPDWHLDERLLLAQIPTVTSVSRQALVSGRRPAELADSLDSTHREARRWTAFWTGKGLDVAACHHDHLALDRRDPPAETDSARTQALCLIETTIDDMVHDATLGTSDFQASLRIWLDGYGRRLEALMDSLLAHGFAIYVTSDHGHVEARGFGRPSEGLTVETRGRRARMYSDRHAVRTVEEGFAETIRWHDDGLLPDDVWVLMPRGRRAFTTFDELVVTHGGPTLDEVVVPLVTITADEPTTEG